MSYKYKEVFAAAAEVLGMVLAYMEEKQHVRAGLASSPGHTPPHSFVGVCGLGTRLGRGCSCMYRLTNFVPMCVSLCHWTAWCSLTTTLIMRGREPIKRWLYFSTFCWKHSFSIQSVVQTGSENQYSIPSLPKSCLPTFILLSLHL